MAEALYDLGEGLHWTPTSAPRGEFIAIQDRIETNGSFLVHHFLALFLKAGHRVCLVNISNSKEHYAAVGRKLGVNHVCSVEQQQLRILDCFHHSSSTLASLLVLLGGIREAIADAGERPVSVVIDDISAIKWQFDRRQVTSFLRCCRALTHSTQGRANVVILSHADGDGPSDPVALGPLLGDIATVVLTVAPLPSGYFRDVHGTLTIQRQSQGPEGVYDRTTRSFKVLETTIKCFVSGGDALRSL